MTTYEHNGLGQRTAKTVLGTTTRYAYDEQGHLLGEYTAAGSPLREYVWLADTPVLLLVHAASPPNSPPAVYFIHADQIDTPRIVQDNQYRNRWAWDPDGFGQLPPNDNPQGLGSFTFNLRMPGQFFDAESGLYYNHFRDYDPQTGRYIESDPIGLAGGVNTYSYVEGDPIRAVDPYGLQKSGTQSGLGRGLANLFRPSHANDPNIPPELGGPQPYIPPAQGYSQDPRLDPQFEPQSVCTEYVCPIQQPPQCTPGNLGGDSVTWLGGPFASFPGWNPTSVGCKCVGSGWSYKKVY